MEARFCRPKRPAGHPNFFQKPDKYGGVLGREEELIQRLAERLLAFPAEHGLDDHAIVRQGWRQIIAEGFEQMVVAETGSGRGVLDTVKDDLWSAVVLDVDLPDMNGLDVLKELKARRPDVPVVILSFHTETEYAVRAFRAGAKAYLTKDSAPDELLAALKKAMQGGRYVTVSLAEALAESFAHEAPTLLHQTLSDRELAVLCLIAKGKTLTETADQLCLSVSTVGTYRSRLLEKLKLRTTAELIRYALRHHLVQ